MIKFLTGVVVLFAFSLTACLGLQRGAVKQVKVDIPERYQPGSVRPMDSTCDWMSAMNYNAYCEDWNNHDLSFSYDQKTGRIDKTNLWIYRDKVRIGDLVNQLGTPSGELVQGYVRHICWNLMCAYVSDKLFSPVSQVSFLEYLHVPYTAVTSWRGFHQ